MLRHNLQVSWSGFIDFNAKELKREKDAYKYLHTLRVLSSSNDEFQELCIEIDRFLKQAHLLPFLWWE